MARFQALLGLEDDLLDALVLGPRLRYGTHLHVTAWAAVTLADRGLSDDKLICSEHHQSREDIDRVLRFFHFYARCKGLLNLLRRRPGRNACDGLCTADGRTGARPTLDIFVDRTTDCVLMMAVSWPVRTSWRIRSRRGPAPPSHCKRLPSARSAIVAVSPAATARTPSSSLRGSMPKPSPQAHRLPSARIASEWREPVAMARAPSNTAAPAVGLVAQAVRAQRPEAVAAGAHHHAAAAQVDGVPGVRLHGHGVACGADEVGAWR